MAIDREKVLQSAQKYVEKKKYDKAVLEYRRLIEADPNDARTLLKIGDLQAKQGLHQDAIATYDGVGRLYAQQGFALKAIAVYKQIREIIAKHAPQLEERYAHIAPKLAELYQQLGLTSDALAALDEVATRFQRQQRDAEAIEVFRKIVELDPTNPLPHLRLAEALSRVQDIEGAVAEFKAAAAQLATIGRRDDALKVLERLLHHKADPAQARFAAELYLARGQQQDGMQALAKLQLCFQANPRDLDTLSLLARAFNTIGQGAKAIEVQKEMARVARETGKPEAFREIVERLQRVAPHDEGVRKLIAQQNGGASDVPPPQASAPREVATAHAPAPPPARPVAGGHAAGGYGYASGDSSEAAPEIEEVEDFEELSDDEIEAEIEEEEVALEADTDTDTEMPAEVDRSYAESAGAAESSVGYAESAGYAESTGYAETMEANVLSDQVQNVIADASAFRRVRLYDRALEVLRNGLDLHPLAMDLHEVYRDVLIEAGQLEDAVVEMLTIASIFVDGLDGESAARALQDVLAFDPQNTRALQMLEELGYEIVDENEPAAEGLYATSAPDNAPLPAYQIEESRPIFDDATALHASHELPVMEDDGHELPSFPLDEPVIETYGEHASDTGAYATESSAPNSYRRLEEALDEADFFCSRGLYEDARAIVDEQLRIHPTNPLLRERLAELDAQQAARGSGAREKPRDSEGIYELTSASLDGLEALDYVQPAEGHANADEQIDVEEVFAKFKEGVAKQISVDDSDSHYNLGIAYKEMMLVDDAIREFDVAARDPKYECICRSMIGTLELERGRLREALDAFLLGLGAPSKDPDQELALFFEVGATYEALKMNRDALGYFQKVMRRDPNYRDVQERIRRLSRGESKAPPRQAAVGADDEFDRAFDDLLSKA